MSKIAEFIEKNHNTLMIVGAVLIAVLLLALFLLCKRNKNKINELENDKMHQTALYKSEKNINKEMEDNLKQVIDVNSEIKEKYLQVCKELDDKGDEMHELKRQLKIKSAKLDEVEEDMHTLTISSKIPVASKDTHTPNINEIEDRQVQYRKTLASRQSNSQITQNSTPYYGINPNSLYLNLMKLA